MNIPSKLLEFLNENQVFYQLLHHPTSYTAEESAHVERVPASEHAKVVMVGRHPVAQGPGLNPQNEALRREQHCLVVLPSDRRVDLGKLERVTGPGARIESEREFESLFPDCEPGAMPPFGQLYDLPTYVDRNLSRNEFIVFEAGTHEDAIKMRYRDFAKIADALEVELAGGLT